MSMSPSGTIPSDFLNRLKSRLHEEKVRFIRLQFIDIMGTNKNVEIPDSQFEKALSDKILFDGSSIEGFVRIEESDMRLKPDPASFCILPWEEKRGQGKVARLICDIIRPEGTAFDGCCRTILKKQVDRGLEMGFEMMVGPEAEFFLFQRNSQNGPTTVTHDAGGYFDLAPIDQGEEARREIVNILEQLGFEIETTHHEVAPGQHEIDFKYEPSVKTADNIATFRWVVRKVALDYNLHATFMPKPVFGINGSGMHCHLSLFKDGENAFDDPKGERGLSKTAYHFIAGLLTHAKAITALANPLVNSYKRLVPGYEAPTHIAWSEKNRSPLCRIPASRGHGSRVELRSPDPSCNPYLAIAAILGAGLDGIEQGLEPPPPVNENIYLMGREEREHRGIGSLPGNLNEALQALLKDEVIAGILGKHCLEYFCNAKKEEWHQYIAYVSQWELDNYLARY
jgi:glutamine synthetase